jgi:hypothetical protein
MDKMKSILRQLYFDFLTTDDRKKYELMLRAALDPKDIAQVEARYAEYLKDGKRDST